MKSYIFDNAAEPETAERFASLDALYNFRTFRVLETTGIARVGAALRSGWERCGGGMDGRARRTFGNVLVTDIEPRFIDARLDRGRPTWSCAGRVGIDPLPERAFDLIHARLVLQHVPQLHQGSRGWWPGSDLSARCDRGIRRPHIDRAIPTADAEDADATRR